MTHERLRAGRAHSVRDPVMASCQIAFDQGPLIPGQKTAFSMSWPAKASIDSRGVSRGFTAQNGGSLRVGPRAR